VEGNLIEAALRLLRSNAFAIAGIVHSRPSLLTRPHEVGGSERFSSLEDVEGAFAAYLEAERKLGRIDAKTDAQTIALTLVGTVRHIFMTKGVNVAGLRKRVRRIVTSLI
jgi:hypothetical protein